jgi:hypothetical protein
VPDREQSTTQEKVARLKVVGFTVAGCWKLSGDALEFELSVELASARNVLYAFVVDDGLMYVGKTVDTLRKRMYGYKNPGATQSTNIRNNAKIRESLAQGRRVEILALPDNGLLHYGGFHVNLAAGLEDSLVRDLMPTWNGGRKEASDQQLTPTELA